jgi:predicted kinase
MIGASGSGKSAHVAKEAAKTNAFVIDPDEIKAKLNKDQPLSKDVNAELHPAASDIAAKMLESYFNNTEAFKDTYSCDNVIFDNRGKSPKKLQKRIEKATEAGLSIKVIYVEVELLNCLLNVFIRNLRSNRAMYLQEVINAYESMLISVKMCKMLHVTKMIEMQTVQGFRRIKSKRICNLLKVGRV